MAQRQGRHEAACDRHQPALVLGAAASDQEPRRGRCRAQRSNRRLRSSAFHRHDIPWLLLPSSLTSSSPARIPPGRMTRFSLIPTGGSRRSPGWSRSLRRFVWSWSALDRSTLTLGKRSMLRTSAGTRTESASSRCVACAGLRLTAPEAVWLEGRGWITCAWWRGRRTEPISAPPVDR